MIKIKDDRYNSAQIKKDVSPKPTSSTLLHLGPPPFALEWEGKEGRGVFCFSFGKILLLLLLLLLFFFFFFFFG